MRAGHTHFIIISPSHISQGKKAHVQAQFHETKAIMDATQFFFCQTMLFTRLTTTLLQTSEEEGRHCRWRAPIHG